MIFSIWQKSIDGVTEPGSAFAQSYIIEIMKRFKVCSCAV